MLILLVNSVCLSSILTCTNTIFLNCYTNALIEFVFNLIYHANRFTNEVNVPDEQYMLKFQREKKYVSLINSFSSQISVGGRQIKSCKCNHLLALRY